MLMENYHQGYMPMVTTVEETNPYFYFFFSFILPITESRLMDRRIKELSKVLDMSNDSLEYDIEDFAEKINEVIRLLNDHEQRVGHATGQV